MQCRVVVAAVIENNGKILLGKKGKNVGPYPNKWVILGGGVNLGEESLENALKREIREEANIEIGEIERISFDEDYKPDKSGQITHYIFLSFKVEYLSGKPRPGDDIEELRWFDRRQLKKVNLPEVTVRLFKKLALL